jgi:hypothetical protein
MLPAAEEMGINLGDDVLALSRGYDAWKSIRVPITLTWMNDD